MPASGQPHASGTASPDAAAAEKVVGLVGKAGEELASLFGWTDDVPTTPTVAISRNFPDPSIIKIGKRYYAFATGGNGHVLMSSATSPGGAWSPPKPVQGITSPSWAAKPSLLPGSLLGKLLPQDASHPGIWAPDVHALGDGKYIMYFSTKTIAGHQAIGYAMGTLKNGTLTWTAPDPGNPIISAYHGKEANPYAVGGAIDPSFFKDPATGKTYIVYKNDGNSQHKADSLWIMQVNPGTGLPLKESPIEALTNARNPDGVPVVQQGSTIEAPQIVYHEATKEYVMFYSSGHYNNGTYTEHYATAASLTGPWKKGGTLLETGGVVQSGSGGKALSGPGGATVLHNGTDNAVIVFHNISQEHPLVREMVVARLQWTKGGVPYVEGGTRSR